MLSKRIIGALMAALLLAPLAIFGGASGAAASQAGEATFVVEFTNLTSGQYLTPPNYAAHESSVDVFERGQQASPGVQAVAENGGVPVLAAELNAAVDAAGLGVSGVGAEAPVAPGQSSTFEFTTSADRFSLVSMIICTNDGFGGIDSRRLPARDGQTRTWKVRGYDAGTEVNTELRADLVPAPFCGEGDGSTESNPALAENGVITRHRTLRGVGDLDPALDWNGPVAEVTITRIDSPAVYEVTVHNTTAAQYLTPPNYAAHESSVDVFERGQQASAGVQAVAENGGVPVLAAELNAAIDAAGLGVSGVGAEAPIPPGQSASFTFTTTADRFSLVSMIICTNDGFGGIDSRRLPAWVGDSKSFNLRAYDAGTEVNTELRADLVPAPFCGEGDGSTESNPALAENGVITRHRTLRGVGDLDPALDWRGPVGHVTITRIG